MSVPERSKINNARLDALLNAFFDKEIGVDESGDLFKGLRSNPAKAREFALTRRFVEQLRRAPETPDLTNSILRAVHAQRPWLRERDVWRVRFGRLGLVAALLLVLGGTLLNRRATPDAAVWNAGPAPLTDLVRSSGEATERTRQNAQAALATLRNESPLFGAGIVAGFGQNATASVVSYKPAIPDVPQLAARYGVSFKPVALPCASSRVASVGEYDVVISRFGVPDAPRDTATIVTFRPR